MMSPSCSRRSLLQTSGLGLLLIGSGCSAFSSTATVTVGIVNSTEQPRIVYVEIRRNDTVVWSQRADVPPDRGDPPMDDAVVETKHALTDVAEGAQLEVKAWLDDKQHVESKPLVIKDVNETSGEWVTIRIKGRSDDAWVDIST